MLITFTTTDIPSTINTHSTELKTVMVQINNTKHITIANIYIPPRDSTSVHYKTVDMDIPHSVLTGDSRCHQQLRPYNTKHTHQPECQTCNTNRSAILLERKYYIIEFMDRIVINYILTCFMHALIEDDWLLNY